MATELKEWNIGQRRRLSLITVNRSTTVSTVSTISLSLLRTSLNNKGIHHGTAAPLLHRVGIGSTKVWSL